MVHTYLFTAPVWTTKRNFSSLSTTIWYWSLFRKCALPRGKKNWRRFNDVNGFIDKKARVTWDPRVKNRKWSIFFGPFSDPVLKQNALRYNPVLKQNAKWPGKQPKKNYFNNWRVQRPQNIINKPGLLDRFLKKNF